MAIPGYDPDDIEEARLEDDGPGAEAAVVAARVPDRFALERSDADVDGAIGDPVRVRGLDDVSGLDAARLALEYDPADLPPEVDPDALAVGVATDEGLETLDSTTDSDAATVSATVTEAPPGETVVLVAE